MRETEPYKQKKIIKIPKTKLEEQKIIRSPKTENEKGKNTQPSIF